ncbi:hypothetical protein BDV23DRAFT_161919 [Aspergillus alliaceus]|uniref:Uncharacterized protein n=1 Tax=Petromyces alliaceus TaxID=209559 RepID=A0A5N7BZ18_PETAA|nr:hypothetical protein BDV23DRAFT_161919 [Aspergillus alliaceus]
MDCDADCPNKKPSQLDSEAKKYKIEEIDFAWSARKGWSSKTETGLRSAVSGAAYYVAHEPAGTYQFCSSAYSTDGTVAHIGFNFYGDKYAPDIPPAC